MNKQFEGKKIRGSDNGPNFVLIDSNFHLVTPELVSYEFVDCTSTPNLSYLGYSKPLKCLYVQYATDKRYIFQDVPVDVWQNVMIIRR